MMGREVGRWLSLVLVVVSLAGAAPYADPDGAYALDLPAGWSADRQVIPDMGVLTRFGAAGDTTNPFAVFVVTAERDITEADLAPAAERLLGLVVGALGNDGEVLTQTSGAARFAGQAAVRGDATHRPRGEARTFAVKAFVVTHGRWAYVVMTNAPQGDAAAAARLDAVAATVALASKTPASAGAFTQGNLTAAARRLSGGSQPKLTDVLAPGDPPLTVASVVHFAGLLAYLFDVQLTETEYEMTCGQFIEYYNKGDAQGKQILATSATSILTNLQQGTAEEKAKNRAEVEAVFRDRLQNGAKAGIPWAQALWSAIERRHQTVATTAAKPTTQQTDQGYDTDLSEADLDAACEMLYFMWVAAGRDAKYCTPEALQTVRALLAKGFPTFPQQLQVILANAQKVYSQLRGVYLQATPQAKAQYGKEFAHALDVLGLKDPNRQPSAWDDVDPSNLAGELVQTTCWNLSQRATGGAWPSSPRGSGPWG